LTYPGDRPRAAERRAG